MKKKYLSLIKSSLAAVAVLLLAFVVINSPLGERISGIAGISAGNTAGAGVWTIFSNASCTFNGATIGSGSSVTAYLTATVPYGNTCISETRPCSNGSLAGTYTNASCTVRISPEVSVLSEQKPAALILNDGTQLATHITQNGAFQGAATSEGYFIENQRFAYYVIAAGVIATGTNKAVLLDKGLTAFEWGFAQMSPNGSFPDELSNSRVTPAYKGIHQSGFFIEAAARSAQLLLSTDVDAKYKTRARALIPKLHQAALFMAEPTNLNLFFANNVYTNQLATVATAFAEVGKLSNDATLTELARVRMAQTIARETPDGVFPEIGGFDTNYQTVSLRYIATYGTLLPYGNERKKILDALQKGWDRFLQNVRSDGAIDDTGNTRTTACGAPVSGPGPKGRVLDIIPLSLYHYGYLTNYYPYLPNHYTEYSSIADKIELVGQAFAHYEHCTEPA